MPNISLTLPDVEQSVFRPIIIDIIGQVQEITKMNKKMEIFFPGDIQTMHTPGSTIDSKTERYAIFNTMNVAFIEVEETYNEDDIASMAVTQREHIPVFSDKSIGTHLSPVYTHNDVTINFRYRCKSKNEALRWRDDIRMRVSMMRDINLHSIHYHYPLPLEALTLLTFIHKNIEDTEGYGLTFPQYMKMHSSQRLTLIGDLVNKDQRLVITEQQTRIIGRFDFEVTPEKPEREDDAGTWMASFAYKFSYDKPIACNMKYPIMIHNQLLPQVYTTFTNNDYDLDVIDKAYPKSRHALNSFETDTILNTRRNPTPYIRLPRFDDFVIPSYPVATGTIFIALSEVSNEDKKSLMNLNELGDILIDPDVMEFLVESELPYLTKLYYSILHLSLYRNNDLLSPENLEIDSNLNIKSTEALSLRDMHHVRLGIVVDFTRLTKEAIIRLKAYPKAFVKIIAALDETLRTHPQFQSLYEKRDITNVELSAIYEILTGVSFNNNRSRNASRYLGPGLPVNNWPNRASRYQNGAPGHKNWIFKDIDPRLVEYYRNNRINTNTVLVNGLIVNRLSEQSS